ncbi:MAG: hypothetical protein M0R51_11245 [Clostridia bacterium]|jgi:hypothetical protein|nr:hypothetical protein [Clostridia bacterium]
MNNFKNVNLIDVEKQDYSTLMESFNKKTFVYNNLMSNKDSMTSEYVGHLKNISNCKEIIAQLQYDIDYRTNIRKDLIKLSKFLKTEKDAREFVNITLIIAQEYCNFYRLPNVNVPEDIGVYKKINSMIAEISTVIKYLPSNDTIIEKAKERVPNKWINEVKALDNIQKMLDFFPKQRATKDYILCALLDGIKSITAYIEICQNEINTNLKNIMNYASKINIIKLKVNTINKKLLRLTEECEIIKDKLNVDIEQISPEK